MNREQIEQQRSELIKQRSGVAIRYARAKSKQHLDVAADYLIEYQRLTANIKTLQHWLDELRLADQGAAAVKEVERYLEL